MAQLRKNILKFGNFNVRDACNSEQLQQQCIAAHKIRNNVPNLAMSCHHTLKNEHNPALTVHVVSSGLMANEHRRGLYHGHVQRHPLQHTEKLKTFLYRQLKLRSTTCRSVLLTLHSPTLNQSVHKRADWSREEQIEKKHNNKHLRSNGALIIHAKNRGLIGESLAYFTTV